MAFIKYICLICISGSITQNLNSGTFQAGLSHFTLFVVLSLFTGGSPNSGRKYSDCVAGTGREKREDNKERKIIKWDRPEYQEL